MDAWMAEFADNAVYYWNSGDSLVSLLSINIGEIEELMF
jgi:hypothetical protein